MEAEAVICEVMAGWARRGYYELDALLAHNDLHDCKGFLAQVRDF